MKMQDFVVQAAITANLQATERSAAIKELVAGLVMAGAIPAKDSNDIAQAIIDREKHSSTGFGKAAAAPHVKDEKASPMMATIGRSGARLDAAAPDRRHVATGAR